LIPSRCVVARTWRRGRPRRPEPRSQSSPSPGSVPAPISSSRTRLRASAAARMIVSRDTWAEKVLRSCAMLCSSRCRRRPPGRPEASNPAMRQMQPACAMRARSPTVFRPTLFPPAFGPVITRTRAASDRARRWNHLARSVLRVSRRRDSIRRGAAPRRGAGGRHPRSEAGWPPAIGQAGLGQHEVDVRQRFHGRTDLLRGRPTRAVSSPRIRSTSAPPRAPDGGWRVLLHDRQGLEKRV